LNKGKIEGGKKDRRGVRIGRGEGGFG